ncbi:hypothetical protein [Bartonella vinsonii]|nr:hypothetical protein [Bartonella vinsonii]
MAILFHMVVVGLPYVFIKRMRLYFSLLQELKNTPQPLHSQERKGMGQNSVLDKGVNSLSFTEAMGFGPKECKILFFISLIIAVLQATFFIVKMIGWESGDSVFISLSSSFISTYLLFFTPIIGILCIKYTGKLRITLQQLEEAIEQRDRALRVQDAIGEKDDQ